MGLKAIIYITCSAIHLRFTQQEPAKSTELSGRPLISEMMTHPSIIMDVPGY